MHCFGWIFVSNHSWGCCYCCWTGWIPCLCCEQEHFELRALGVLPSINFYCATSINGSFVQLCLIFGILILLAILKTEMYSEQFQQFIFQCILSFPESTLFHRSPPYVIFGSINICARDCALFVLTGFCMKTHGSAAGPRGVRIELRKFQQYLWRFQV